MRWLGKIILLAGPMFSGKTFETFSIFGPLSVKRKFQVFKWSKDVRPENAKGVVGCHNGMKFPATEATCVDHMRELLMPDVEVVVIEEGHFWGKELVKFALELRARGIIVIINMLIEDWRGEMIDPFGELVRLADEVIIKRAICVACEGDVPAVHTQALVDLSGKTIAPGGKAMFEPRCVDCFDPYAYQKVKPKGSEKS